ncbi:hypothetical protein JT358_12585 [Micrococcales bacterium 31B]|nr:hypothetical protein [Micrococcales bacterium 31B]
MAPKRSRAAAARSILLWVVVPLLALGGVAVAAVITLNQSTEQVTRGDSCTARVGGTPYSFTPVRVENAALIAAISMQRDMPARAATIGIATAIQESRLENIDYGDRDSVGLFQQRTSQGWGTIEQIMDPVYSTNKFYSVLETVPNYTTRPVTEVAQAVQLSGYPEAYADHEQEARAFASAFTGNSGLELTCSLTAGASGTQSGSTTGLVARNHRDFGETMFAASPSGSSVSFTARQVPPSTTADLALVGLANWAVAQAAEFGVETVRAPGGTWSRSTGTWVTSGTTVTSNPADAIVVTLAAPPAAGS